MSAYIYWIINPEGDKIERTRADTAKECLRKYGLLSRYYLPQGYGIYRVRNNGFNGHSLRECALAVAQVWER